VQVNEALAWIHGKPNLNPGEMAMVSLSQYSFSRVSVQVREGCLAHDYYPPSHFIGAGPDELTVADLLDRIPGATRLLLDFDVVAGWLCPNCGEQFTRARLSRTSQAQAACPDCGSQRSPQIVHEIGQADRLAGSVLCELGVPARSILRIKAATGDCYVEIDSAAQSRSNR
jgi:DNA-directed RNA polymerase subunit RPC12/RpoP